METNLTFEQQLIHTMLKSFLQEKGLGNLSYPDIDVIKSLAKRLSEGTGSKPESKLPPETKLTEFDFKVRTLNGLKYNGIETVGQLTNVTDKQLTMFRLIGYKSYREIKEFLTKYNLKLKKE